MYHMILPHQTLLGLLLPLLYIIRTNATVQVSLYIANQACSPNANLGTFATKELCAASADGANSHLCGNSSSYIMWSDGYSSTPSWGCRCCISGTAGNSNYNWAIYAYSLVTNSPTAGPTVTSTTPTSSPTSSAPTSSAPTSSAPTSSAPTSSAPTSSAPTSSAPTLAPATQVPTTTPTQTTTTPTQAPTSSAPTFAPTSSAPTLAPATQVPSTTPTQTTTTPTQAPTSSAPTSFAPTSSAPTSSAPTSSAPTFAPTSSAPTLAPATQVPSTTPTQTTTTPTQAPTSSAPTSSAPTSSAPTSSAPTSSAPTSSAPTSSIPTLAPATQIPTTTPSTAPTLNPTTTSPTTNPTTRTPIIGTYSPSLSPTASPTLLTLPIITVTGPDVLPVRADVYLDARVNTVGQASFWTQSDTQWKVYRSRIGQSEVEVVGLEPEATSLKIPRGILQPSQTYRIAFQVTYSNARSFAANLTRQTTPASPLVALIEGGTYRTARTDLPHTLDASSSYDPDNGNTATSTYTWSCTTRPTSSPTTPPTPCPAYPSQPPSTPTLSLPSAYMTAGNDYKFTVIFELASAFSTRRANTSTTLTALSTPIPSISITEGTGGVRLGLGKQLQLIASALPHPGSSSGVEALTYSWSETGGTAIGAQSSPTLVLNTQGVLLGGASYEFEVTVMDPGASTSATARAIVTILAPPTTHGIRFAPASGEAFLTTFHATANATGDPPLSYKFAYETAGIGGTTSLTSFSYASTLNTTFPAGNHTLRVYVKNAEGVEVSGLAPTHLHVYAYAVGAALGGGGSDCTTTNSSVGVIRAVLRSSGADSTDSLGICTAVDVGVQQLADSGAFDTAISTITNIQSLVNLIPNTTTPASACPSLTLVGTTQSYSGCLEGGNDVGLTISGVGNRLLGVLVSKLNQTMSNPNVLTRSASLGIQSALRLSTTAVETKSTDSFGTAATLVTLSGSLIASSDPEELASTSAGEQVAETLSNAIALTFAMASQAQGGGVSSHSIEGAECAAAESAAGQVYNLLERVGLALVPGAPTPSYNTMIFNGSARSVFSDTSTTETLPSTGGVVTLPASQSDGNSTTRPRSTLSITEWGGGLSECRNISRGKVASSVVSVSLIAGETDSGGPTTGSTYFQGNSTMRLDFGLLSLPVGAGESATCGETGMKRSCEFWDVSAQEWSAEGCRLDSTGGRDACICSHLTEFAILEKKRDPCVEIATGDEWLYMYSGFTGLYALLFIIPFVQAARLALVNTLLSPVGIAHLLLAAQGAVWIVSCVMFGGLGKGFEVQNAHSGMVIVVACLPYSLMFISFVLLIFQWIAIVHNTEMSRNPFEKVRVPFIITTIFTLLLTWASFSVVVIQGGEAAVRYASIVFSAVCIFMTVVILSYGLILVGKMSSGRVLSAKRIALISKFRFCCLVEAATFLAQSASWVASAYMHSDAALYAWTCVMMAAHAVGIIVLLILYRDSVAKASSAQSKSGGSTNSGTSVSRMRKIKTRRGMKTERKEMFRSTQFNNKQVHKKDSSIPLVSIHRLRGSTEDYGTPTGRVPMQRARGITEDFGSTGSSEVPSIATLSTNTIEGGLQTLIRSDISGLDRFSTSTQGSLGLRGSSVSGLKLIPGKDSDATINTSQLSTIDAYRRTEAQRSTLLSSSWDKTDIQGEIKEDGEDDEADLEDGQWNDGPPGGPKLEQNRETLHRI